jgi:molybdate transport system ATP-binding protein
VASGVLWVPGRIAQVGARVRLRVMAQDVIIGTQAPEGLSALNVLPTTVVSIHKGAGPGAMVLLDGRGDRILARITQRSLARMGLVPGQRVYAILKSVSVGPEVVFGG